MPDSSSLVLLMSAKGDRASGRSHCHFESRHQLAQNLIDLFEEFLATAHGADDSEPLNYSSEDLFEYMDSTFDELVCLERQPDAPGPDTLWIPNTSTWIKEVLYEYLRDASTANQEEEEEEEEAPHQVEPQQVPAIAAAAAATHNNITHHANQQPATSFSTHLNHNTYEPPMEVDGMNDILIY